MFEMRLVGESCMIQSASTFDSRRSRNGNNPSRLNRSTKQQQRAESSRSRAPSLMTAIRFRCRQSPPNSSFSNQIRLGVGVPVRLIFCNVASPFWSRPVS